MGSPLLAFALVADEYEKSGDPIKGLRPLFAPILQGKGGQEFNAGSFADRFRDLYGLGMTPYVAGALAERLVEIGLLEVETGHDNHLYKIADFDWSPRAIEEKQIDKTAKLFARWAKPRLESVGRAVSEDKLEDAILVRLARPEFASIFVDRDGAKKNARLKGLLGIGAVDQSAREDEYLDYLVAEFVLKTAESAPQVFESISQISYGALVADAVAGLAVPAKTVLPDNPLRVVFDGPLVLDLLDLNTVEHRAYAEGLLEIVKGAGLMIAVFDHSIDEMRGTIRATLQSHARGTGRGPMAERFRTTPGHTLYATTVIDSLESKVTALGFTILRSQIYEEARYKKHFPDERVDQIRNSIGDLHEHLDARIRDAMSVATVARLKGERRFADSVLSAGTIFVTRNSVLCKRVLRSLSIGRSEPDPRFTIATDGQLAGVLWFVGSIAGVELSRKRLIANCSSAVLPKPDIISRITTILSDLSDELREEFEVLMTDRRASLCPMRMTAGVIESVDAERSMQILKSMRDELAAPAQQRAEEAEAQLAAQAVELERTAAEGKEVAHTLQVAIEGEQALRDKHAISFNEQLAQLEFDLSTTQQKLLLNEQGLRERSAQLSHKVQVAEEELRERTKLVRRLAYAVLMSIVVGAELVSIFVPDFQAGYFRLLLAVIYISSLRFVSRWFRKAAETLARGMFASRKRYIAGLREGMEIASRAEST